MEAKSEEDLDSNLADINFEEKIEKAICDILDNMFPLNDTIPQDSFDSNDIEYLSSEEIGDNGDIKLAWQKSQRPIRRGGGDGLKVLLAEQKRDKNN